MAAVDPKNLTLHVHAYFGSVKLRSRMSMGKAASTKVEKDSYGNTIYEVHFYEDRFVYDNLDISELDVERELGAYPYAIIRVEYKRPGPMDQSKFSALYVPLIMSVQNLHIVLMINVHMSLWHVQQ